MGEPIPNTDPLALITDILLSGLMAADENKREPEAESIRAVLNRLQTVGDEMWQKCRGLLPPRNSSLLESCARSFRQQAKDFINPWMEEVFAVVLDQGDWQLALKTFAERFPDKRLAGCLALSFLIYFQEDQMTQELRASIAVEAFNFATIQDWRTSFPITVGLAMRLSKRDLERSEFSGGGLWDSDADRAILAEFIAGICADLAVTILSSEVYKGIIQELRSLCLALSGKESARSGAVQKVLDLTQAFA